MIAWSIRNVKPLFFLTVILCLFGAVLYSTFPTAILPDVTFPRIVVVANSGDRPVDMMQAFVTRPLEQAVATIPNVERIRSNTERGSAEISVDFSAGQDMIVAEQLVNAKINQLHGDFQTEVERMNPTVFPILGLTLTSDTLSPTQLWTLATYVLQPKITRAPGVARCVVQGGQVPNITVRLDLNKLAGAHISADSVVKAITNANMIQSVGRIDENGTQYEIVVNAQTNQLNEIRNIAVATQNGIPIRVGEIADVNAGIEDQVTVVSANGHPSVLLNVVRQPTANTAATVQGVKDLLAQMRKSLPPSVKISPFYDQSILVNDSVASVRDAVLIGIGLSIVVLLLFLGDLRATILTASIIPITLLITFVLMRISGLTLNLMTLGALAVGIGLVIDDAIVVVENVFRNMAGAANMTEAVLTASSQIATPMISSTLTTVVVFLPLAFLSGVAGAFFSALAVTLSLALIVSLVLALTISPTLCARFLKASSHREHGRFFEKVLRVYESLLRFFLKRKALAWVLLGVFGFSAYVISGSLKTGFMPEMDEGAFILDYTNPPGTSLKESNRILTQIDKILLSTPDIQSFSRRTGTELGFSITEPNRGDYAVMLKDGNRRPIDDVIAEVRHRIQTTVAGPDIDFSQVLQDLIGDLAGSPAPIQVKFFGENKADDEAAATALLAKVQKLNGIADSKVSSIAANPDIIYTVDPGKAGQYGVTAADVASQADTALFGTVATTLLQGDRQVGVRVRFPQSTQASPAAISRIPIQTPGGLVPLSSLASVSQVPGITNSNRENQQLLTWVEASLQGIDLGTAVSEVKKAMAETPLPAGVTSVLSGQYQSQQETFVNFAYVLAAAVLLVFLVMLFQFKSFWAPSVILILMPLSLFGAVLALYITNTPLNVSSFMGAIMLMGIVVKNGILLLDRANQGLERGWSVEDSVFDAGRIRLRPILMTTLTAILGLLPLALGIGSGAQMQQPLAISVIGGLLFSTILTLIIGPSIFASVKSKQNPGHPMGHAPGRLEPAE